jgi:hypothetical protein
MTVCPSEPSPADERRWAAQQFGLGPEATAAEARSAFLRALPETEFSPSPSWHRAAWVLSRPDAVGGAPDEEFLLETQEELRTAVEDFAAEFFDLPVAPRQSRWRELRAACAGSPPLLARLRALEPGLAVDRCGARDRHPDLAPLVDCVCELFVLRPAARAARRQAFLAGLESLPQWETAARQLREQAAVVAGLEPVLVGQLASWSQRRQQRARNRSRSGASARSAPDNSGKGSWSLAGILIFIVLVVVRGAAQFTRTDSPSRTRETPSSRFQLPDFKSDSRQMVPDLEKALEKIRRRQLETQRGKPFTDEEWQKTWNNMDHRIPIDKWRITPPRDRQSGGPGQPRPPGQGQTDGPAESGVPEK